MTDADLARLGRTVVHLRPGQMAHRARLRAQQAGLRRFPEAGRRVLSGPDPSAAVGWPDALRPVDARTPGRWPGLSELRAGKIRLLGLVRELGDPPDWEHADAPRLWRFHLHYWDWAWGLAADPDRLAARAAVRPAVAVLAGISPDSASAMPGTRTPPRCAPGHGAACTATSPLAATSNRSSSPGWRLTRDSCAVTWSTTWAATT